MTVRFVVDSRFFAEVSPFSEDMSISLLMGGSISGLEDCSLLGAGELSGSGSEGVSGSEDLDLLTFLFTLGPSTLLLLHSIRGLFGFGPLSPSAPGFGVI